MKKRRKSEKKNQCLEHPAAFAGRDDSARRWLADFAQGCAGVAAPGGVKIDFRGKNLPGGFKPNKTMV